MNLTYKIILIIVGLLVFIPAYAAYTPFNTNVAGNIGVGTSTPQSPFVVVGGNVGIGTWTADGGNLIVNGNGNVGIGSTWPGQTLDLQGNLRVSGTLTGALNSSAINLTANIGVGTITPQTSLAVQGPVGIGTWTTQSGVGLDVLNGNVGIGTYTPQAGFVSTNNIGIGTWTAGGGNLIVNGNGNVGIGSAWPGQTMDMQGNLRVSGTINGTLNVLNFSVSGNMGVSTTAPQTTLAVEGAVGIGTWTTQSGVGLDVLGGNVGIGTYAPRGLFVVNNGNVGIGTALPGALFQVNPPSGNPFIINSSGNVGIGTPNAPTQAGLYTNGNVGIGTWVATNFLSVTGTMGAITGGVYTPQITSSGGASSESFFGGGGGGKGAVIKLEGPTTSASNFPGTNLFFTGTSTTVNGPERIRIDANGNVGIGSWGSNTINNSLAVVGEVGVGTVQSTSYIQTTAPSGGINIQGNLGIGTFAPNNGFVYNNCAAHANALFCWGTNGCAGYCTSYAGGTSTTCTCSCC